MTPKKAIEDSFIARGFMILFEGQKLERCSQKKKDEEGGEGEAEPRYTLYIYSE